MACVYVVPIAAGIVVSLIVATCHVVRVRSLSCFCVMASSICVVGKIRGIVLGCIMAFKVGHLLRVLPIVEQQQRSGHTA